MKGKKRFKFFLTYILLDEVDYLALWDTAKSSVCVTKMCVKCEIIFKMYLNCI